LYRFTLTIHNDSASDATAQYVDPALQSLASTHSVLAISGGAFVSLIDPPAALRGITESLKNEGAWPVLVGPEGSRNMMLASPIILYDYPQVAGESVGDLFDATEIDEILSLRIMTLTDAERQQAASLDSRVRDLLQRTESLSSQQFGGLHGTIRGLHVACSE